MRSGSTSRRALLGGLSASIVVGPWSSTNVRSGVHLKLGLTPVFLSNDTRLLALLREHLAASMGIDIEFVQRRTYKEVVSLLLVGEIDAAWLCGYPLNQHSQTLTPLAVPLWRGAPQYRSYIITSKDRKASRLSELKGDIHAFSDPDSNSGYLVTVSELIRKGLRPETFFARTFFTFGHRNVVIAIARGLANSGSVDGYVWESLAALEPSITSKTRIVWESEPFGFPPIVVTRERRGSGPINRLHDALLNMGQAPTGAAALKLLQLDGFVDPPEGAFEGIRLRMADLQALR